MKGLLLKDLLNLSSYKTTLFVIVLFYWNCNRWNRSFSASCDKCNAGRYDCLVSGTQLPIVFEIFQVYFIASRYQKIVLSKYYVFAVSSVLLGGLIRFCYPFC